jgi:oxidoreductase
MASPAAAPALSAVVTGGTGAIGRELVVDLLASPAWGRVTVVGRRRWEPPPSAAARGVDAAAEEAAGRLVQAVVDLEALVVTAGEGDGGAARAHWAGADAAFCTLGTTHGDAGSMAAFRRVDLDYVAASAAAAAGARVPYFAHVTAQGTGSWASSLTNYGRTKAAAEAAIEGAAFPAATVLRPGLLDRGGLLRPWEAVAVRLLPSTPVATVATALRRDAERSLAALRAPGAAPSRPFRVIDNADIPAAARGEE